MNHESLGKRNKLLFILCFCIIAVCCIATVIMNHSFSMNEPVFISNYLEILMKQDLGSEKRNAEFDLYYIADKNFNGQINRMKFPENPGVIAEVTEDPNNNASIFSESDGFVNYTKIGHYQLHKVHVTVSTSNQTENEINLTKAVVYYSNGQEQTIEIPQLNLIYCENTMDYFTWSIETYDDYDIYRNRYKTNHELNVCGIRFAGVRQSGIGLNSVIINDKVYQSDELEHADFYLTGNDELVFEMQIEHSQINNPIQNITIVPTLLYQRQDGTIGQISISQFAIRPSFETQWQIYDYLKGLR